MEEEEEGELVPHPWMALLAAAAAAAALPWMALLAAAAAAVPPLPCALLQAMALLAAGAHVAVPVSAAAAAVHHAGLKVAAAAAAVSCLRATAAAAVGFYCHGGGEEVLASPTVAVGEVLLKVLPFVVPVGSIYQRRLSLSP